MSTMRLEWASTSVAVIVLFFITNFHPVRAQDLSNPLATTLTPTQIREDLEFLRDEWIHADRSFSSRDRRRFESIIDAAIVAAGEISPAEFALEAARAVAVSGNGHTNVDLYAFAHLIRFLPIRVWWFSDGLYVVESHPDLADLLGRRIVNIGSHSAEDALDLITPFISGTEEHVRYLSPGYLVSLESLLHAGVIQSSDEVPLTVEFPSGEQHAVTLRPQAEGRSAPPGGYGIPIPSPLDDPDRWPHVLDGVPDRSPAFRAPTVDVDYEWMKDDRVLYIRSNQVFSSDDDRLDHKLLGLVVEQIVPRRSKFVIVDLRLNTGGDLTNTILFSQMVPELVPADGRVFVLVGNVTYSAALVTAAMLKGNGGDKVKLIGETMGDGPRFWAEGLAIPLPNSRIPIAPATGYHDWANGCAGVDGCYWAAEVFAIPGVSLEPDIVVPTAFQDYAAGRDTVLETALALAK